MWSGLNFSNVSFIPDLFLTLFYFSKKPSREKLSHIVYLIFVMYFSFQTNFLLNFTLFSKRTFKGYTEPHLIRVDYRTHRRPQELFKQFRRQQIQITSATISLYQMNHLIMDVFWPHWNFICMFCLQTNKSCLPCL